MYACKICNKIYKHTKSLRRHIHVSHEFMRYACPECGIILKRKEYVSDHRRTKHKVQIPKEKKIKTIDTQEMGHTSDSNNRNYTQGLDEILRPILETMDRYSNNDVQPQNNEPAPSTNISFGDTLDTIIMEMSDVPTGIESKNPSDGSLQEANDVLLDMPIL